MTTTSDNPVYLREKLVMNISNDPDRIEVVDRLNIHMVKTKKYRTKSDAVFSLLKVALDRIDEDEREEKREKREKEVAATAAAVSK
jgi:hypothetical protein